MTSNAHHPRYASGKRWLFLVGSTLIVSVTCLLIRAPGAEARVAPGVHPIILPGLTYMGNASCAGSGCHGDDKPKTQSGQNIGDESNIWAEHDPHSHAYKSLKNDASKKIAAALKLKDPLTDARCINCHSTNAPAAQRGELFSLEDASGCESCHGPGQKWLNPHAKAGWTTQERKTAGAKGMLDKYGLADTSHLSVRAHTCVACHLQIDKDMLDAGHPALEFEMYAYNYYISKDPNKQFQIHWDEPKGQLRDAKLWAAGQFAALEAAEAQAAAWKGKGWDLAVAQELVTLYKTGSDIAKANLGVDSAEAANGATLTGDKAAAAAKALAATAGQAKSLVPRRVTALGVAALGAAFFDGKGAEPPDDFWTTYDAALAEATAGGDKYVAAVKKLADLAK